MEERHCGTCTLCCKLLAVEELAKPTNKWCEHCAKTSGCTIYETRPASCRTYQCIWLQSQFLAKPMPVSTRPDHSHVVLDPTVDDNGLVVRVDPGYPDAWKRGPVGKAIANVIAQGQNVIILIGDKRKAFVTRKEQKVLATNVGAQTTQLIVSDEDEFTPPFAKR